MEGLSRILDIHNMPFYLINFLILVVAARIFVYKPVVRFMKARQEAAQAAKDTIDRNDREAQQRLDEIASMRNSSITQTEAEIGERLAGADRGAKAIIAEAQEQAAQIVEAANIAAREEAAKAREELREEISRLSVQLAGRILEREVKLEDHKLLVDEFLDNIG